MCSKIPPISGICVYTGSYVYHSVYSIRAQTCRINVLMRLHTDGRHRFTMPFVYNKLCISNHNNYELSAQLCIFQHFYQKCQLCVETSVSQNKDPNIAVQSSITFAQCFRLKATSLTLIVTFICLLYVLFSVL